MPVTIRAMKMKSNSADPAIILDCCNIMTSLWLGHETWAIILLAPVQHWTEGTNPPSTFFWSCRSRRHLWDYLLGGFLLYVNVRNTSASHLLTSPITRTPATDVKSFHPTPPGHWQPGNSSAEKMPETEGFSASCILRWTSWVGNPGQFPQDVLTSPYGLKCSIMKRTAALQQ